MWNDFGTVQKSTAFLYYKITTYGGNSGSPILKKVNGEKVIIGVHISWSPEEQMSRAVLLNTTHRKALR